MSNYTESTQYLARQFVENYLRDNNLTWSLRDQENLERKLELFLDSLPLCSEDELVELRESVETAEAQNEDIQKERDDLETQLTELKEKLAELDA